VCIWYFWQGNHQRYGHIRCIYTVLANPINVYWYMCTGKQVGNVIPSPLYHGGKAVCPCKAPMVDHPRWSKASTPITSRTILALHYNCRVVALQN
jgi:hypothetical protein